MEIICAISRSDGPPEPAGEGWAGTVPVSGQVKAPDNFFEGGLTSVSLKEREEFWFGQPHDQEGCMARLGMEKIIAITMLIVGFFCLPVFGGTAAAQTVNNCTPVSSTKVPTTPNYQGPAITGCLVTTPQGKQVNAYLGIQYASQSRWQLSTLNSWPASSSNATSFGTPCPQTGANASTNEDCLYLNIWTPPNISSNTSNYPVLVFIHGGAFIEGAGSDYDGSVLASQNIIVVTLNYRLGALGFLYYDNASVGGAVRFSGNYGLLDQQTALKWVVANIPSFGGSATNITLAGESAGAMSVGLHTFSVPTSSGLFQQAIMESNPLGTTYATPGTSLPESGADAQGSQFLQDLCAAVKGPSYSCPTVYDNWASFYSGLSQSASVPNILSAQLTSANPCPAGLESITCLDRVLRVTLPWAPVMNAAPQAGSPVFSAPPNRGYASGTLTNGKSKPILFGVNANEGALFIGMAASNASFSSVLTGSNYQAYMVAKFGLGVPAEASAYCPPSMGDTCATSPLTGYPGAYPPPSTPPSNVAYNDAGAAMANVANDYIFACANLAAINAAATSASVAKATPQVGYAYRFNQVPPFDLFSAVDNGACSPAQQLPVGQYGSYNVCHGHELPYVFNDLAKYTKQGSVSPVTNQPADQAVADQTTSYWATFVKGQAPWPAYSQQTPYVMGLGGNLMSPVNLNQWSNCPFWAKYPYQ